MHIAHKDQSCSQPLQTEVGVISKVNKKKLSTGRLMSDLEVATI